MRTWPLWIVAGCLVLSACTVGHPPDLSISHTTVPALSKAGAASMDVVEIDQSAHRLYAADRTDGGIDVYDVSGARAVFVKTIAVAAPPSGLAVAPDLGRVFAGLGDGSVAIVDTTTDTVIKNVPTGGKSVDLVDYAPDRHELFASNGAEGTVAAVDAVTGAVRSVFKLGFTLEQPRYDTADRMLYVTSPDAGALFKVDPATGQLKRKISLAGCQARGLAINPTLQQALIACTSWVVRMNLRNPADASGFTQVGGGDVVSYDAAADRFFVAAPDAKPSEVALFGGNPIDFLTAVPTAAMGNAAAYDETRRIVYTPDVMPGAGGLASFALPSGDFSLTVSNSALALFGALVAGMVGLLFLVGRLADPVRKRVPAPSPQPAAGTAPVRSTRTWTRKA